MPKPEKQTITIIGVGNIGFRYLEAVLEIRDIIKIYLIEPNQEVLKRRIEEKKVVSNKNIVIKDKLNKECVNVDLIVVSTTSNVRLKIINELISYNAKCPLILEKFLFPNRDELEIGDKLLDIYPSPIYVNQWMRLTVLKKIIKSYSNTNTEFNIIGKYGILCNSVHFIDLIKNSLEINDFKVDKSESYCKEIVKSKREGYKEFKGVIGIKSKATNNILRLIDINEKLDPSIIKIEIKSNNEQKVYNMKAPNIEDENKNIIGKVPYLSEHAINTIDEILKGKIPEIPNFKSSIKDHLIIVNGLREILKEEEYKTIYIT